MARDEIMAREKREICDFKALAKQLEHKKCEGIECTAHRARLYPFLTDVENIEAARCLQQICVIGVPWARWMLKRRKMERRFNGDWQGDYHGTEQDLFEFLSVCSKSWK